MSKKDLIHLRNRHGILFAISYRHSKNIKPKHRIMKSNFILLLTASAFLGACNNNPSGSTADNKADTMSMTTTKVDNNTSVTTDTTSAPNAMVADSTFLDKAYNIGTFEIKIAKLAQQKSQNAKVKELAGMMIQDHTAMGADVTALMKSKNYDRPTDLPSDLKDKWNELSKLSGKDFDKKYAEINVNGHKEALDLFKGVSMHSKDNDVKKLATDALPKLQMHEDHSLQVQSQVNS